VAQRSLIATFAAFLAIVALSAFSSKIPARGRLFGKVTSDGIRMGAAFRSQSRSGEHWHNAAGGRDGKGHKGTGAKATRFRLGTAPMFRFTIRDVPWLTVVVALAVGWWLQAAKYRAVVRDNYHPRRDQFIRHLGRLLRPQPSAYD